MQMYKLKISHKISLSFSNKPVSSALFSPCVRLGFFTVYFLAALGHTANWVTVRRPELRALAEG